MSGGQTVDEDIGQIKQQNTGSRGQAHRKQGLHGAFPYSFDPPWERKNGGGLQLPIDPQEIHQGDHIGQHGGNGSAHDLISIRHQYKHKQRIQRHIEQPAHAQTEARLFGMADIPHHSAHGVGEHSGQSAQDHNKEQILPGIADGIVTGTQQAQQRIEKQQAQNGKRQRGATCHKQADGCHLLRFRLLSAAQQANHQCAAAHAKEVGQRRGDPEHCQHQRRSRHHIGIIGLPDKPCVRHIVDQNDQLAGNGRQCHFRQCLWHRHGFKYGFCIRRISRSHLYHFSLAVKHPCFFIVAPFSHDCNVHRHRFIHFTAVEIRDIL